MQTLSKKIHGEVQKFLISQQEKDKKQNSSTSDLNELSSQKSSSSFRCRWEIFAEDILYCMACSELLVELKSRTEYVFFDLICFQI